MFIDKVADSPAADLNGENKNLRLEAEKAGYLETIAKANRGTAEARKGQLDAVVPSVTDAPKGEVKLGEKAGAFGPWRAHQVIEGVAEKIAKSAAKLMTDPNGSRVLVVDDRSILPSDWTAQYVQSSLDRLHARLEELGSRIKKAREDLDADITRYEQEPGAPAPPPPEPQEHRRRGPGGAPESASAAAATAGTGAVGAAPGALGAAVNLLGLLRTDYSVTATAVSATASELATLTAGHLAAQPIAAKKTEDAAPANVTVEADVFSTMRSSPTTDRFAEMLTKRDRAVEDLSQLQARLAPVEAELTAINATITLAEQTWAAAVTYKKDDTAIALLRATVDNAAAQASGREKAAGPALAMVTHAQQVIADVDAAAAALLKPAENGETPLFTAARRERLHLAAEKITHILYVNLDAVAADAVTRRSVLGTSGRIRFLSAGNASWLLLSTATGTVTGGGQVSLADAMTFSLEDGSAEFGTAGTWLTPSAVSGSDPLNVLEYWTKGLVVVLVVVLFALGFLSVLAVVKIALG